MKNIKLILLSSFIASTFVYGQEKTKSAHQHHAKHNGKILMLGDAHFEVTGNESMVMIYTSDKFGDDLVISKIGLSLELVEGAKRRKLDFEKDPKVSNLIHVKLPKDIDKNLAELTIRAKNIDMPKGQSVPGTFVKVAIKSLAPIEDPHAGHHM